MKKWLLLAAALLLTAAPLTAFAEGEEEDNEEEVLGEELPEEDTEESEEILYTYGLDAEGNAELYDFIPSDTYEGPVVIPAEIEGHPVDLIGNACFMNAAGITEVTIPANITDMGESVFFGCTSLETFHVEPGNPYYATTSDGVLVADNGSFLVAYPAALEGEKYTIPAGVDEIAPGAFGFAQNLREVVVPDGVNFIDNWSFAYSAIEKISIAGSVVQIDDYAFAYCTKLSDVELGSGIEVIYHAAFYCDEALKQITLPNTLTMIGQYAFCGTGMPCVTIPNSLEVISFCAFGYDSSLTAMPDFIIYGEPYTMAQQYATDYDLENDYENHFEFIAVVDASIPYELGGGMLYEEAQDDGILTETNENGDVIVLETDENGNPIDPADELGAGLKGNKRLQLMLGIGGGIAVVLAVILVVAYAKKPKKKIWEESSEAEAAPKEEQEEAPESHEDEEA